MLTRIYLILILIITYAIQGICQTDIFSEKDSITFYQLFEEMQFLKKNDKLAQAISASNQIESILKKYELKDTIMSQIYADFFNEQGNIYRKAGKFNIAKQKLTLAKNIINKHLSKSDRSHFINLNEFGLLHSDLNDFEEAYECQKTSLQLYKKYNPQKTTDIASLLINMGQALMLSGNFSEAESRYKEAQDIFITMGKSKEDFDILSTDVFISNIYFKKNEHLKAINLLKKVLKTIFKHNYLPEKHRAISTLYSNIGASYISIDSFDSGIHYLKKSLSIEESLGYKNYISIAPIYTNLGTAYLGKKEYNKALSLIQKSNSFLIDSLNLFHHSQSINSNIDIGRCYDKMGKIELANQFYHKAVICSSIFNHLEIDKNPRLNEFINPIAGIRALFYKATGLYDQYLKQNDTIALSKSFETIKLTVDLISQLRTNIKNEESILILEEIYYLTYEVSILISYHLYKITQNSDYLYHAHKTMEHSKATLLNKIFQDRSLKSFNYLPDSILKREKTIEYNFELNRKAIIKKQNDTLRLDSLLHIKQQLLKEQKIFQEFLKTNYYDYYQLKYQEVTPLEQVQNNHTVSDKTILEYFVGDSSIYFIVINQDSIQFKKQDNVIELKEDVQALINLLENGKHSDYQAFSRLSFKLYQKLILPVKHHLNSKILIVPDGNLHYLPFEALLIQQPIFDSLATPEKQFRDLTQDSIYLIYHHQIQYASSVQTYIHNQSRQPQKSKQSESVMFLPNFDKQQIENYKQFAVQNNWPSLDSDYLNAEELAASKLIFNQLGALYQSYQGAKVTESKFYQETDANTLLLFTHSLINDVNPMDSKILFAKELSDTTINDGNLFAHELYNTTINSDLAILACCETGKGEYYKGEGVMSIARGFSYAGCPSIVMSMWKVDDSSTAKILSYFDQNLNAGLNKSEALHKAKLEFLEKDADRESMHPYYWSAFVLTGNDLPIFESKNSLIIKFWWLIIVGILLIGLSSWYLLKLYSSRRNMG